jgi:hypothetical protein
VPVFLLVHFNSRIISTVSIKVHSYGKQFVRKKKEKKKEYALKDDKSHASRRIEPSPSILECEVFARKKWHKLIKCSQLFVKS